MLISEMNPAALTRDQITNIVFGRPYELDNGNQNGDCIFVFGGIQIDRVDKAAELYHNGRAPYILFTGGDKWGQRNSPESHFLREEAMKRGVPSEAILVEQISNHTKENIMASLIVLDRAIGLESIKRMLLVSSPGHMRRCLLMLQTFMPPWYEYVWCPDDRALGQAHNWWTDAEQERRVRDELHKIIGGVKGKYFVDENISLEDER